MHWALTFTPSTVFRHNKCFSCIIVCFYRIKLAQKEYMDAFNDELDAFKGRIRARAKEKIEEAIREHEEVCSYKCIRNPHCLMFTALLDICSVLPGVRIVQLGFQVVVPFSTGGRVRAVATCPERNSPCAPDNLQVQMFLHCYTICVILVLHKTD